MTKPMCGFTVEEITDLGRAANSVWNEVAYDLLTAIAEERNKDVGAVTVSRNLVIEIVCDAGRLEEQLRPELADKLRRTHLEYPRDWRKILKPAFPYTRYGL